MITWSAATAMPSCRVPQTPDARMSQPRNPRLQWDIFCRVIDNYGDIGVCWRLARQLVQELDQMVRLWVDDLVSFQRLCPEIDLHARQQWQAGVEIRHWQTPPAGDAIDPLCDNLSHGTGDGPSGAVVVEAFACELPDSWLAAMASRQPPPLWINLEYLSAEAWVAGCHGLASRHPQWPLTRHFYFPGFTPSSGGLLREDALLVQRRHWQQHPELARQHFQLPQRQPDELWLSLFCYHNPALPALLDAWVHNDRPLRCLLPLGLASQQISRLPGWPDQLHAGQTVQRGALTLHILPFVRQQEFDLLLWSCDMNFVRGEDSLVRAIWAARPLVWQPYPQDDQAHVAKLAAWLEILPPHEPGLSNVRSSFCHAWGQGDGAQCAASWPAFQEALPQLQRHADSYAQQLSNAPGLARQLLSFCLDLL